MAKKRNYSWLAIVAFIILIFFTSGCTSKKTIKIGVIAELTGKQSELGINLRNGAQLAAEEINSAGGINGHPIELIIKDDLGTPQGAEDAENWVIDQNVVAIIGHLTSNQTVEGYKIAEERGVLLLSGTASTTYLSGKKDLFFRTEPSNDYFAKEFAKYIRNVKNVSTIAVLYDLDNNTYSTSMARIFSETFTELGGTVTAEMSFSGSDIAKISDSIDELVKANIEAIYIIASPLNTAHIAQLIRLQGSSLILFAAPWAQGQDLINNGGDAVEGLESIIAFNINDSSQPLVDVRTKYKERFAEDPAFTAMFGYELLNILAEALKITDGNANGLSDALLSIRIFQGLDGKIYMDEFGDSSRNLYIIKLSDHQFETIDIITPQEK